MNRRIAPPALLATAALVVATLAAACAPAPPAEPAPAPAAAPLPVPPPVEPDPRPPLPGPDVIRRMAGHTVIPQPREPNAEWLSRVRLPAGFRIGVWARDLANPRMIAVHPEGWIYLTEREAGRVTLLQDTDGDGTADRRVQVSEGFDQVHGVELRQGRLWMVAINELEVSEVRPDGTLGPRTRLIGDLMDAGQHPNRTLRAGPDGMLYLSVGSLTNDIPDPHPEEAVMLRVDPATGEREIWAEGLRNTIGFDFHPATGELWGMDHNTDWRGDNEPPEQLNRIRQGRHYGWPWCYADRRVDRFTPVEPPGGDRHAFCATTEPYAMGHTAHAAPMGMRFYRGEMFPEEFRHDAFLAMRGSWNRNPPYGYKVMRIRFDDAGQPRGFEDFASGWLERTEEGWAHYGRLSTVAELPDGSLLVNDDHHGVIYRIWYEG